MRALAILLILLPFSLFGQNIKVMSYNIRYDNASDGPNKWELRKSELVQQIIRYRPAIFGIQEGLINQCEYIDSNMKKYKYVGVGREDGKTDGEHAAIFYDTTKIKVLYSETFWFSETPDTPSKAWGANHKRICTYGKFKLIDSGKTFYFFNVHLDHESEKSRKNSVKLLTDSINSIVPNEAPVIIVGDFNCGPNDAPIKLMKKDFSDSYRKAKIRNTKYYGTFNGFDKNFIPDNRIDYIFTKNLNILKYEHKLERRLDDYFLSDHLPIVVDLEFVSK